MTKRALPIGAIDTAQNAHPAIVQSFKNREGSFDRRVGYVGQFRPGVFVVRFDDRLVFGERELETDVGVHVAFGDVMDHLPNGPSAVPVGSVDLLRSESGDGGAKIRGG